MLFVIPDPFAVEFRNVSDNDRLARTRHSTETRSPNDIGRRFSQSRQKSTISAEILCCFAVARSRYRNTARKRDSRYLSMSLKGLDVPEMCTAFHLLHPQSRRADFSSCEITPTNDSTNAFFQMHSFPLLNVRSRFQPVYFIYMVPSDVSFRKGQTMNSG